MIIVLFDLEGTLVKSIEDDKEAVREFRMKTASKLIALGIPTSELKDLESSTLMRNRAFEIVNEHFDKKEALKFHYEMDRFLKNFEMRWARKSTAFLETYSVLQRLKEFCKVGLVTNTSKEAADLMLSMHGIHSFFDVIVTREDVKRLKPDPEGILLALKKLGGQNFFFVGDSSVDSSATKRAGGMSIMLKRNPLKVMKSKPEFIASSLKEVVDIVQKSKDGQFNKEVPAKRATRTL